MRDGDTLERVARPVGSETTFGSVTGGFGAPPSLLFPSFGLTIAMQLLRPGYVRFGSRDASISLDLTYAAGALLSAKTEILCGSSPRFSCDERLLRGSNQPFQEAC